MTAAAPPPTTTLDRTARAHTGTTSTHPTLATTLTVDHVAKVADVLGLDAGAFVAGVVTP